MCYREPFWYWNLKPSCCKTRLCDKQLGRDFLQTLFSLICLYFWELPPPMGISGAKCAVSGMATMEVVRLHSLEPLGLPYHYLSSGERVQHYQVSQINKLLDPTRPFSSKICFYMLISRSINSDLHFPINRFQKIFCWLGSAAYTLWANAGHDLFLYGLWAKNNLYNFKC